ncbi:MAG: glycosyltransferase, partial [Deltaproteobacteria bacterium]|nr:glycosyltransferase [Deltaproteobacteria bacterium]
MLFLPEGEGRQGEGGLRTKGYFKFSYKLMGDGLWYMCDLDGNPVKPAPEDVQENIKGYLKSLKERSPDLDIEAITELPLVTVITVVLNGEKYLEETIQSVINQTYPNIEYIVIDGGSTDNTLNIVNKYKNY